MSRAILTRMEKTLREHEPPSQTGFRRGFSTIDNIHTVKQIAEKSREYGIPVYLAFVDFRKAFDCVEWPALWSALTCYGIHPQLTNLLRRLYEHSQTHVMLNGQKIEVTIKRGVKQGDTLSPQLFNIALRSALDRIDWCDMGLKMGGQYLPSLEYADDVTLIAQSRNQLKKMLRMLKEASATVGLTINHEKTILLTSCPTQ